MREPTHVIVTRRADNHAELVMAGLETRGARCLYLDPADFPSWGFLLGPNGSVEVGVTQAADRRDWVSLQDVQCVWWRQPDAPTPADWQDESRRESFIALENLWSLLRDRSWVNPLSSYRAARIKPIQLAAAKAVGFDTPRTLVTNDPRAAIEFGRGVTTSMVYKTFESAQRSADGRAVYTTHVTADDIATRSEAVELAPCLFQECLDKVSETRVTCVGGDVFAMEITPRGGGVLPVDWRKDPASVTFRPARLSRDAETRVRALLARLGLVFGCVDLVKTRDRSDVFLEVNPCGQWYWVELLTGLPVLASVLRLLDAAPQYG